jgi:tetratricopeptide (TPR) repeat protein
MTASTISLDRYYRLFGLTRSATVTEIKSAYRQLARKFHPDLNPDNHRAHEDFTELDRAYRSLLEVCDRQAAANQDSQTADSKLKWDCYHQIQSLIQQRHFLKAIAVIEGMAHRFPEDLHVRQWQGIIYSRFARELIRTNKPDLAKAYLNKALKADPHNRKLAQEVAVEMNRI